MAFFGDLALVMIDEVHLLGDERGGALEAVISRLKVLSERASMRAAPLGSVRFAACSATVSNLTTWGDGFARPPEGTRRFGEEYRPVTLETKVLGYDPAKNDYLFERRLNDRLMEVVTTHYDGKPALVFCNRATARRARRRSWRQGVYVSIASVCPRRRAPKPTRRGGVSRELWRRADHPARG